MANVTECDPGLSNQWKVEQIISDKGVLNEEELEEFMKLHKCGVSYAIVAIVGPQSSGKSTLVNHLFHTNFEEMDALIGRGKTTKGIWIAKAPNVPSPCIMVMDVEGTDGKEKGQDDTKFEKWSALFCLVVADVIFINMWRNSIGLENAANRPLLKTIFEVMMQIFPSTRRKATLHFIIRDKGKSPMNILEPKLRTDLDEIWNTVTKTENFKDTPLCEIFNVEVDALPSYEYAENEFITEVSSLREKVLNSIREAGHRGDVIPTSGLPLHVKELWETIKKSEHLDLPNHKRMVATVRCEEIAKEKLQLFENDEEWLELKEAANARFVPHLGEKIWLILSRYLSKYDSESKYYEEGVRNAKLQNLERDALRLPYTAYINTLGHLRKEVLKDFESRLKQYMSRGEGYGESVAICWQLCEYEFDERCSDAAIKGVPWDASDVREQLVRDFESHTLFVRADKFPQIVDKCRARLLVKIDGHLNDLFRGNDHEGFSWAHIRSFVERECDSVASDIRSDIASFELDPAKVEETVHGLKQSARMAVVRRFNQEKEREFVIRRMKERYVLSLERGEEPLPKCLNVLSTMAAIRLEENPGDDDRVERVLSALLERNRAASGDDPLASGTWEEVPPDMILITPAECKDIWQQVTLNIQTAVQQMDTTEDISETPQSQTQTSQLPYWLRLGALVLGVNGVSKLLWRNRLLVSSLSLGTPLGAAFLGISLGVSLLGEDGRTIIGERVNGCKRVMTNYKQIITKLEEALEDFHSAMMARFPRNSQDILISEV